MRLLRRFAPRNDRQLYLVWFNSQPEIRLQGMSLRSREAGVAIPNSQHEFR
jgi:hypothetical protein